MGGHVHRSDPFATPPHLKSPARRLRGRMPAPVTVWTSGSPEARTGLTMSSVLVGEGDPPLMIGLMNDTTDLWEAIQETETWIVHLLSGDDQVLADRFAGLRPTPGGLFVGLDVEDTEFGPLLTSHPNHAYCRLLDSSGSGFQQLVRGNIETAEIADLDEALAYFRGNYRRVT